MIADGGMVPIFNSWDGTFTGKDVGGIPANGNPWTAATADLSRISDGQILEHWQVANYSNFTEAVGISEN
jgi:predicted ester cyclase